MLREFSIRIDTDRACVADWYIEAVRDRGGPVKDIVATVVSVHAGSSGDLSKQERPSIRVELDGVVGDRHRLEEDDLDDVALDRLNHKMISFKDVAGTGKKQVTFDYVPINRATEYACEDSDITRLLAEQLLPEVKSGGFDELFRDMEMPLVKVLAEIERLKTV